MTALWLVILGLYVIKLRQSKMASAGIAVLLVILAIDAFRSVFESIYFGIFHNSRFGLLPPEFAEFLGQPSMLLLPKAVNITAGVLVLVLLIRHWLPREIREGEEIRRKDAVLRSVFDDAAVGMVLHAPDGSSRDRVNNAFCDMVGYSREELLGNPYEALTHPDDLPQSLELRRRLANGETDAITMEKRYLHKDGHPVWGSVSSSIIRDDDGKILHFVSFIQDISARKKAEQSLREATESAIEANRTKSHFLATMSHEFRTPLNAILGFSQLLGSEIFGPLGDKRYKGYADNIRDSGELMLELVNDVLDISTIEAGKREMAMENVILQKVVSDCVRTFATMAEDKAITVESDIPADLLQIWADRRAVVQITLNLLSNAIKFTEPGGSVTVKAALDNDVPTLSVSDTGIGIPPDVLKTVTEPFTRSHSNPHLSQTGTGLGLSIVKSLAEAHGSTLEIESAPGQGTRVSVRFPEVQAADTPKFQIAST
ncbi:MAG: PAS domain S-box protein [Rhodospirillales bacterium]